MADLSRKWPITFNPTTSIPGSKRALTEYELAAIWIYLEKSEAMQSSREKMTTRQADRNIPRPDHFPGTYKREIISVLRTNGVWDSMQPGQQRKDFVNNITDSLFKGLLFDDQGNDIRDQLAQTDIIRRIMGLGYIYYTDNDIEVGLLSLDRKLKEENPKYINGSMSYSDVERASKDFWIIPELGIPLPSPASIKKRIGKITKTDISWEDARDVVLTGISGRTNSTSTDTPNTLPTSVASAQNRELVIDKYVKFWAAVRGRYDSSREAIQELISTTPPPTQAELAGFNVLVRNEHGKDMRENLELSEAVSRVFPGGVNEVLATLEKSFEVDICLTNPRQLTALVRFARTRDPHRTDGELTPLPSRVRDAL